MANEEATDSRNLLMAILDSVKDGIALIKNNKASWCNPRFTEILGWSHGEIAGKSVSVLFPNEEEFWGMERAIFGEPPQGKPHPFEYDFVHKDGGRVPCLATVRALDENDRSKGWIFSFDDITALGRAEKALQKSQEKFRSVMDVAPNPMVVYDIKGSVDFINPAFTRIFGWTAEEVQGGSMEFGPGEDSFDIQKIIDMSSRGEPCSGLETRGRAKNGDCIHVRMRASAFRDSRGEPLGVIINFQDITEDRRTRESLVESEERYRVLFEESPEGILVGDIETRKFKYANPAICRMLDYTKEELESMGVADLHPVESLPHVISEFDAQARGEKTLAPLIPCLTKGGKIIHANISTARIRIGGRDCNLGFVTDVTSMKEAQEKLETAKKYAEAASVAKSDFLANMSHELRTPLNHIIGFSELLVDKHFGELNETQEEYLNDILSSAGRLLSLINDILDISKVEAGKMELDPSDIDMMALLSRGVLMIGEKAQKRRIRVSIQADNVPGTIRADERKLEQVIFNLLSNAVKFTPDGGRIDVGAEVVDRQWVRKNAPTSFRDVLRPVMDHHGSSFLKVSVADNGIGIKPDSQAKVFDKFQQEGLSTSRKYGGTGLGLALCKKLLELHKGGVWVESRVNEGSTFRFVIPMEESLR